MTRRLFLPWPADFFLLLLLFFSTPTFKGGHLVGTVRKKYILKVTWENRIEARERHHHAGTSIQKNTFTQC